MSEDSAEQQALRLIKAFYNVPTADIRELIVAITEAAERGASIAATADGSPILVCGERSH